MKADKGFLIALAGQQNAGKSTLFNRLTGARQHVANYPGVTVDKKSGHFVHDGLESTLVDLPGTYSLTSFSLEERVARDFLVRDRPDAVIDVLDATSLKRGLGLVFQLLEMDLPLVLAVNMIDVAGKIGLEIDVERLGRRLGVPAFATIGRDGEGVAALRDAAVAEAGRRRDGTPFRTDYGALEPLLAEVEERFARLSALVPIPPRWQAVMLLQGDPEAEKVLRTGDSQAAQLMAHLRRAAAEFEAANGLTPAEYIVTRREQAAREIVAEVVDESRRLTTTLTDRIDRIVLHRLLAPVFLVATVWVIYELAIDQGFRLSKALGPVLEAARGRLAGLLPDPGFLYEPPLRSLALWIFDSCSTLLSYVPIFIILFALVAALEDSGYMARIAFILDRILHRFGLHGQSTLPYVLGGVFAGGCAVPGVMATKAIPDLRARMATVLTVPFMNCLAKIPLYTLLLDIFFPAHKGVMLLYIATVAVVLALLVAKLLTATVLQGMETAPFVMEMPHYHIPSLRNVAARALERTWMYVRKVATIVLAIAVIAFALLHFPGLPGERKAAFEAQAEAAIAAFYRDAAAAPGAQALSGESLVSLLDLHQAAAGGDAGADMRSRLRESAPEPVRPLLEDAAAWSALERLAAVRSRLRAEIAYTGMSESLLGTIGRGLELATGAAGLDWRINVALITAVAARENSVATLGVLYREGPGDDRPLDERMADQAARSGFTSLSATSLILLFILFPPCLATMISIRMETRSVRWTVFAMAYPVVLGLAVATAVNVVGRWAGADGFTAMTGFYLAALALLGVVGAIRRRPRILGPIAVPAREGARGA